MRLAISAGSVDVGHVWMRIRRRIRHSLIALVLCLWALPAPAIEVAELIRHIDRLWQGETSHAVMTMTVQTRRYARTMVMEAWSRGKDHSLVVIREPVKDRGIATLYQDISFGVPLEASFFSLQSLKANR